jgi:hypothetical protein
MAEVKTFWVCKCGTSNRKSVGKCDNCGKRRSRALLWSTLLSVFALIVLGITLDVEGDSGIKNGSSRTSVSQTRFLSTHAEFKKRYFTSSNRLLKSEINSDLQQKVASFDYVEEWEGKITGVNVMSGKASVAIEVGEDIKLFAGKHLMKGVSTLIAKDNHLLFEFLKNTKSGVKVRFKGSFAKHAGELVEISYTEDGAFRSPKYLFHFGGLKEINN